MSRRSYFYDDDLLKSKNSPQVNFDSNLDQEANHLVKHLSSGRLVAIDIYILVVAIGFIVFLIFGASRPEFREMIEPYSGQLLPPVLVLVILIIALLLSLAGAWLVARRHRVDQSFKLAIMYAGLFTTLIIWVYFLFYYGVDNKNIYLAVLLNIIALLFAFGIMFYNLMLVGAAGFLQILLVVSLVYVLFATLVYGDAIN